MDNQQIGFLYLVVSRGPDAGARLLITEAARLVGRARDVDLVLSDPAVSRRHFRVSALGTRVQIDVFDGAADVRLGERLVRSAQLSAGEQLALGRTVLAIVGGRASSVSDERSYVRTSTLLSGLAADIRGLAAVFGLTDSLDHAQDWASLLERVKAWAASHLDAVDVTLADTAPAAESDAVLTGEDTVTVPAHGVDACWLTARFAPDTTITESTRTLLVVAGRIVASRIAQIRALDSLSQERDAFRDLAIGSARDFLGTSPPAKEVARKLGKLAASDVTVLLEGETGTGKSFAARLLHESSARAREPFMVVNCAAIPENLIESELFGHERGAFTGAAGPRAGAFEAAGKGTLFLDEIAELPLTSQAKLLHALEEKRFQRLGAHRDVELAARIVVATNRDLEQMVAAGTFRKDLFFRVSVVKVRVPALRERGEDLALLARALLADLTRAVGRRIDGFSPAALEAIQAYAWPGNVRELRNAIEHALALGEGRLVEVEDLPESLAGARGPAQPEDPALVRLPMRLEDLERRAIDAALAACGGNRTKAAALLGIDRSTLYAKLPRT